MAFDTLPAGLAPYPVVFWVAGAAAVLASVFALGLYWRLRALQHAVQCQQVQRLEQARDHEREQLEALVRQRTSQLTELAHHLQTAREDERSRLARNLHDDLGALLTSAKLDAARIRPRLSGAPPEALARLAHLVEMLDSAIALGRRIIEDLRPSTLSNLGLATTLEILARQFAERSGVQVHCRTQPVGLEANAELVIYRVVQEGLINALRHAQASRIDVRVHSDGQGILVTVSDDGIGMASAETPPGHFGLRGLAERIARLGGSLLVEQTLAGRTQRAGHGACGRAVGVGDPAIRADHLVLRRGRSGQPEQQPAAAPCRQGCHRCTPRVLDPSHGSASGVTVSARGGPAPTAAGSPAGSCCRRAHRACHCR